MLRHTLVALSLANLCFFAIWGNLLPGSHLHYYMAEPPPRVAYLAIVLNVFLLATLFCLGWNTANRLFSRRARSFTRLVFIAFVFLALNGMRIYVQPLASPSLSPLFIQNTLVTVAIGATGIAALWYWHKWFYRLAMAAVLVLSPLIALTLGQAVRELVHPKTTFGESQPMIESAHRRSETPARRVIWLLFDELDQQLTFAERPSGLKLPEFDRFRTQAIYATNAYPVARETRIAMPALISGKGIVNAWPRAHSELIVTLAETQETVRWSGLPNVFHQARAAGFDTALIGYFHPYCRVLRNSFTTCSSWGAHFWVWKYSGKFRLAETMLIQIADALNAIPFARRVGLSEQLLSESIRMKRGELYVESYLRIVEEAKKTLTSRHMGLILVHLPVPHVPFIYDRFANEVVTTGNKTYLDNLALADRTLGELRREMEEQGLWDDAAILLTSDHWYRNKRWDSARGQFEIATVSDKRIPFLLKLPHQKHHVKYESTFSSIIIYDLLLALLGDSASHPDEIIRFLDTNRSLTPPVCESVEDCLDRLPDPIHESES